MSVVVRRPKVLHATQEDGDAVTLCGCWAKAVDNAAPTCKRCLKIIARVLSEAK